MTISAIYFIKLLLLPPASLLLMALTGLLLHKRRAGLPLTAVSLLLLTAFSLPIVAEAIAGTWASYPLLTREKIAQFKPQAIIVIGGGAAPGLEYRQSKTVNARTLLRLRYAAKLARDSNLPVLVSGGKVFAEEGASEAELMAEVLQNEFNIAVKWQEPNSRNTYENAQFSHQLLHPQAINKILLVTQAYHMPRAAWAFRDAGFQTLPAPTQLISYPPSEAITNFMYFIPSAAGLEQSFLVLHEHLGLLWYQLNAYAKTEPFKTHIAHFLNLTANSL